MQKTIKYSGIEKIIYRFGTTDITKALIEEFNIKHTGAKVELELYEEYEGKSQYAEMVITFTTEKKPPQSPDNENKASN